MTEIMFFLKSNLEFEWNKRNSYYSLISESYFVVNLLARGKAQLGVVKYLSTEVSATKLFRVLCYIGRISFLTLKVVYK